jgi:hypothetical protein
VFARLKDLCTSDGRLYHHPVRARPLRHLAPRKAGRPIQSSSNSSQPSLTFVAFGNPGTSCLSLYFHLAFWG